jgi:hypothetical protein
VFAVASVVEDKSIQAVKMAFRRSVDPLYQEDFVIPGI